MFSTHKASPMLGLQGTRSGNYWHQAQMVYIGSGSLVASCIFRPWAPCPSQALPGCDTQWRRSCCLLGLFVHSEALGGPAGALNSLHPRVGRTGLTAVWGLEPVKLSQALVSMFLLYISQHHDT